MMTTTITNSYQLNVQTMFAKKKTEV